MINPPLQYFPISSTPFEFKTGLRAMNPGRNAEDNTFQIDSEWRRYRNAKMAARSECHDKYVCSHRLGATARSGAAEIMLAQIAREYPEHFELTRSQSDINLNCRLSGEQLQFDQALNLINNNRYQDSLDALCCQVQEDIAVVERHTQRDHISYLHLCLPNHWAAENKIGRNFVDAHLPVPEMGSIAHQAAKLIDALIHRGPFERFAWGIATDTRLNHHPVAPRGYDQSEWCGRQFDIQNPELYLRIERQTTNGLPGADAFIFTIRTYFRAARHLSNGELTSLANAIATMPDTVKAYKGLHRHSTRIIEYLRSLQEESGR